MALYVFVWTIINSTMQPTKAHTNYKELMTYWMTLLTCIIDLATSYRQIEVAKKDRENTVVGPHLGLYEFLYMPFGLTGDPANMFEANG